MNRNKYWVEIVENNEIEYNILFDNLTWEEACNKEKELIKHYGRFFYDGGKLINLSEGGDGGRMPQKSLEKISKRVYQYDLSGKYISEYYSVREAARIMKVDKESIRKVCIGKKKQSCGFKWSYIRYDKK